MKCKYIHICISFSERAPFFFYLQNTFSLAQLVKLSIAISILLSYPLQFYVPLEIIWKSFNESISERYKNIAEYATRVSLVVRV